MAVVDGEPMFRIGAVSVLAGSASFDAVAIDPSAVDSAGAPPPGAGAAAAWVAQLVVAAAPDAVVLDATLGHQPYAADLVGDIAHRVPGVAVVVSVGRPRPSGLVEVMDVGARGLIDRQCRPDELLAAVSAVLHGQNWVAAPLAVLLREELGAQAAGRGMPPLTPREREVLRWLAAGGTNAAVGRRLGISEHTVRNHVHSIMSKLGVGTRTDLVATAVRRGLVDIPE